MKGLHHPANDVPLNPSVLPSIREVIAQTHLSRRRFLHSAVRAPLLASLGGLTMKGILSAMEQPKSPVPRPHPVSLGFQNVPPNVLPLADAVAVPPGYRVEVLVAWGDPIAHGAPTWLEDATQDASAQATQFGMHNDGMEYFPLPITPSTAPASPTDRGLLCVNHEYTHEEVLHGAEGLQPPAPMTLAKARKSQAAHGVSILEIQRVEGRWKVIRDSRFNRRITGNSRARLSGPAAGHDWLRSLRYDITDTASVEIGRNDGLTAWGTLNNCAHGSTPWGTYLTCEENWNSYFALPKPDLNLPHPPHSQPHLDTVQGNARRYGIGPQGSGFRWHEVDPRFDLRQNPLEPHLFGWVMEINPFDRHSTPVKRTALGRFKHESAQVALSPVPGGRGYRVAFYMGDDERNEYIYKFVCAGIYDPDQPAAARDFLDEGVLHVARFTPHPSSHPGGFQGHWIPLLPDTDSVIEDVHVPGRRLKLRELPLFASPTGNDRDVLARILIQTRQAADAVGATMMDRPEWMALRTYFDPQATPGSLPTYNDARPLEIYCSLTNNNHRGGGGQYPVTSVNPADGSAAAGSSHPPVDVANPRPDNLFGHIIRWREQDHQVTATLFEWDLFVLAGDSRSKRTLNTTAPAPAYDPSTALPALALTDVYRGTIGDVPPSSADFGSPDGLWFDPFGRLWIQTDHQGDGQGAWINLGSNVMCCADPVTREVRRFLTAPPQCEVTGITATPDARTFFVGIQHPGDQSKAADPDEFSAWPGSQFATNSAGEPLPNGPHRRPRSAVIVITREDGGVIGA